MKSGLFSRSPCISRMQHECAQMRHGGLLRIESTVADYAKIKATSTKADGEVFGSWLSTWG